MRFTIMQHAVGYQQDESATENLISGQEGILLRLLMLHRGHPLNREDIARHLTRSGRHAVDPGSVPADAPVWTAAGVRAGILMGGACTENGVAQTSLGDTQAWTRYALESGLRGMFSWRLDNDHGTHGTGLDLRGELLVDGQPLVVGRLMNQSAPAEIGEDVHGNRSPSRHVSNAHQDEGQRLTS